MKASSRPIRARGLKQGAQRSAIRPDRSRPIRARGLKLQGGRGHGQSHGRAPYGRVD